MPGKPKPEKPVRTYHLKNMVCGCCIHMIRKELSGDPGVVDRPEKDNLEEDRVNARILGI
jgi:hypothetical protein